MKDMIIKNTLLFTLEILSLHCIPLSSAHSRWKCPKPRSTSTSIKTGPCGDDTNIFSEDETPVKIQPGPLRVVFEESVHHIGAPFRISLSNDGNDDSSCVLLDHIPHNDCCNPSILNESSYTPYVITINIPNVVCEKCSLHLSNPMTDKIGDDGSPTGVGCTDPGTCFSVYHSCTKPFRIVGDLEKGAVLRSEYVCNSSLPNDWPQVWIGDGDVSVDANMPGVYRRESSIWSEADYTLTTVPFGYAMNVGEICNEEVEQASASSSSAENLTDDKTDSNEAESANNQSNFATEVTAVSSVSPITNENLSDKLTPSSSISFKGAKGHFFSFLCLVLYFVL